MVKDAKMAEGEDAVADKVAEKKEHVETARSPVPPLEAAAQRLERLLGGRLTDKDRMLDFYTNPVKVVRRWLGTSSGAAGNASADDIKSAAAKLLDPSGICEKGRSLLVSHDTMVTDDEDSFLSLASAREVEVWLLSLAVRLLWKEKKFSEAFEMSEKAIRIVYEHMEQNSLKVATASSASSLFPLLARLYRWRALVAESINDANLTTNLRADMARAHNSASLRRDADTQATLLNCMLRDLLKHSQGSLLLVLWCL